MAGSGLPAVILHPDKEEGCSPSVGLEVKVELGAQGTQNSKIPIKAERRMTQWTEGIEQEFKDMARQCQDEGIKLMNSSNYNRWLDIFIRVILVVTSSAVFGTTISDLEPEDVVRALKFVGIMMLVVQVVQTVFDPSRRSGKQYTASKGLRRLGIDIKFELGKRVTDRKDPEGYLTNVRATYDELTEGLVSVK